MAQIEDPTGAVFMLWQTMGHTGAAAEGVGACGWTELATKDREKALAFYQSMFGWIRAEEGKPNMDGFDYAELGLEKGKPFMGVYQIGPEMGPMPSAWTNYFEVADCDVTAAKAQELGGRLVVPSQDIPDVGRFCVIADPFGAAFAVVKMLVR
jgi:predicted enzyme related to lactoylglutathione lyase